ncbi:hypothetical protein BDV96DRAFT_611560 [Lophiotrema nucula]|uniref:Uncharacterized protein n=1 Tax=Lophiotrema nucula TaxID=690887 RepID=A0A6A5ZI16_9PLEO|nr:hypothetical protein BDV96DRAFT_611560 [Lophiotrema nucula]
MAPQLCCTAEEEGRSDSPQLPNARISDATTPAKRPLIPKRTPSHGSRFTSARSEDLHELRQIFDNAKDHGSNENSPANPGILHFKRPSVHSLHSLHKVKSMQAFIKRKLSKDLSKGPPPHFKDKGKKKAQSDAEPDTVIRIPRDGPNLQVRITKDDLRKDLLSDKKPQEGGYDSDAEVLDDIAKNIGRRSPSKRPSLHSIDWTSSPGSKHTTPSSAKEQSNVRQGPESQFYQLKPSHLNATTPIAAMFSQFTSSPNLRIINPKEREQKLRRSHSATSIRNSNPSSLLPIRLPSITSNDDAPWSASMHESLRLSRFPDPPTAEPSKASSKKETAVQTPRKLAQIVSSDDDNPTKPTRALSGETTLQIHIQQPTSPRSSSSIKGTNNQAKENTTREDSTESKDSEDVEGPSSARNSVHLYSMRISHHLRSGSLLSWDALAAEAPEMPTPPTAFYNRHASNASNLSHANHLSSKARHQRQSSSSGFASSRVPSKWGKVLHSEQNIRNGRDLLEDESSIYSSRPQSPPDSFFASASRGNLSLSASVANFESSKTTISSLPKSNTVTFDQTDDEETPRPKHRYGVTNIEVAKGSSSKDKLVSSPLARNNSVANTKKSKFREEFSPSPPKKKIIPSASIMQFLRSKKSIRSRSDTSLGLGAKMDGPSDGQPSGTSHERRLSKSMVSLQTEQAALGKDRDAIPMWERALKAHQEERASMFLPGNKALAVRGSPFRDRSGSIGKPVSTHSAEEPEQSPKQASKRSSLPTMHGAHLVTNPFMRRSALIQPSPGSASPGQQVPVDFHKQVDTKESVGAWGRYPSHTREERTGSAGKADDVQPRDFALEKAIQFARGDDEEIDPMVRVQTPPLPGGKKRKKRTGSARITKSHSMTFGKTFLKNYARIFRSQSTEFRRHGHGHRSSITAGGTLQYPELEILPDVFHPGIAEELARGSLRDHGPSQNDEGADKKGKQRADDSQATLRPRQRSDSNPGRPSFDGGNDADPQDKARVWSVYYEDCIPNFPRVSLDAALELQNFLPRRISTSSRKIPSRQVSVRSNTMPGRLTHSRARSRLSRASIVSGVPSFEDGGGVDGRSIVSVRRSTLDLIQMYRDQEVLERERVLSLVRMESRKEDSGVGVSVGVKA